MSISFQQCLWHRTTLCWGSALLLLLLHGFPVQGQRKTMVNQRDGLTYVLISHGSFWMGCVPHDKQCHAEEKPRHLVTLSKNYWLTQTEVTVGAYRRFVRETGYIPASVKTNRGRMYRDPPGRWEWQTGLTWETPVEPSRKAQDNFPVAQVSWDDAAAFCRFAGGRLPTEAEWEYAARGGRTNTIFPWGNEAIPFRNGLRQSNGPDTSTARLFPHMKIFSGYDDGFAIFAPVGSFTPNGFGLFDMAGNVWEWTNDFFAPAYFTKHAQQNPTGASHGEARIVRGGAWSYAPEQHRNSERGYFEAQDFWTASLGFRCSAAEVKGQ